MKVQELKRSMQIQGWTAQIKDREESGLTVKAWCEKNGIKLKTYYNHVKRVREETLDVLESRGTGQVSCITGNTVERVQMHRDTPVFAAVPMPQSKGPAITVWISGHAVDIQNGAESALVEQTLRVVSRL